MKGYKAFNKDWKCRDFQYKIGETYELPEGQELKICQCGFHFCKNPIDVFGYYPFKDETMIAEVEALGEIQQEGTKYVTNKIKIVREFTRDELQLLILDGRYNSGDYNSGHYNSGDCNSGHYNSGRYNSGNYNSGDYNSGNCNSGNHNSGNCNSGNCNSGNHNSGNHNSGNYNSGHYNSGDYNSGHYNSGDYNSGDYNGGHCNSGNHNSGIFNTDTPFMMSFNRLTSMTYAEFLNSLSYSFYGLCLRISRNEIDADDIERIKALPNFDAEIFKEITGIHID